MIWFSIFVRGGGGGTFDFFDTHFVIGALWRYHERFFPPYLSSNACIIVICNVISLTRRILASPMVNRWHQEQSSIN